MRTYRKNPHHDRLVEMILDGHTFTHIANELGLTRCQVAGLTYRIRSRGVALKKNDAAEWAAKTWMLIASRPAYVRKPVVRAPRVAVALALIGPRVGHGMPGERACRWIEGPVETGRWCGNPTVNISSWCQSHYFRVFQTAKPHTS